jgi:hypothetical protein
VENYLRAVSDDPVYPYRLFAERERSEHRASIEEATNQELHRRGTYAWSRVHGLRSLSGTWAGLGEDFVGVLVSVDGWARLG